MRRVIECVAVLLLAGSSCVGRGQATAPPENARQSALALEQQGRNAEAEAAWRNFSKAYPSNPEPYAHLGLLEARQEHYQLAIPLYRKALALNPSVPSVRRNLGLAYFKSGDMHGAIHEFTILLKDHPGDFQLVTLTGMAHYGLGEYKEAVPYLQQAAAIDKQNLPLRLALAHGCLWTKQYQCVLSTYHEILALNADSAEADMLAGEALDEMKDNAGSTRLFREAAKANPKEPNVHFGLGYLLWTQKQYPEAASEFKAELANDPDHVQSMEYLADTDIQLNQMDSARPLLERVVKLNPSLPLVCLDLGIIYTEQGQKDNAVREFLAAEKLTPNDVDVHWRLGRLYRAAGKTAEAKAEFDKAAALNKAHDEEEHEKIANGHPRSPAAPANSSVPPPAATPPNQ
ncbi:MAG: tetratricopeptide repeat protein [Terracidiphilus sp.]